MGPEDPTPTPRHVAKLWIVSEDVNAVFNQNLVGGEQLRWVQTLPYLDG